MSAGSSTEGTRLAERIRRLALAGILVTGLAACTAYPPPSPRPPVDPGYDGTVQTPQEPTQPGAAGTDTAEPTSPVIGGPSLPGEVPGSRPGVAVPQPSAPPAKKDPRVAASNSFIGLGKRMLDKGDADGAIRMLERAVGINPNDGPGYYYLAEAWLMKKEPRRAEQFNALARVHLGHDAAWRARAEAQYRKIKASLVGKG